MGEDFQEAQPGLLSVRARSRSTAPSGQGLADDLHPRGWGWTGVDGYAAGYSRAVFAEAFWVRASAIFSQAGGCEICQWSGWKSGASFHSRHIRADRDSV